MFYESSHLRALYPQDHLLNKKHMLALVKYRFRYLVFQLLRFPVSLLGHFQVVSCIIFYDPFQKSADSLLVLIA